MSVISRIGKRFTVVIPKEVRSKVNLREGSMVVIRVVGDRIVIEPLPNEPFKILEEVIGEPYHEEEDEKRAIDWLERHASR